MSDVSELLQLFTPCFPMTLRNTRYYFRGNQASGAQYEDDIYENPGSRRQEIRESRPRRIKTGGKNLLKLPTTFGFKYVALKKTILELPTTNNTVNSA